MEEARSRPASRYLALLSVVALHVAIVAGLLVSFHRESTTVTEEFVTTLLDLPALPAPKLPVPPERLRPNTSIELPAPQLPQVSTPSPVATPPPGPPAKVDWAAQARRSAEAIARQSAEVPADPKDPRQSSPSEHPIFPAPVHHEGEQYQLNTGEKIVWVSSKCYLISDPEPLGAPDVIAHARVPRLACPGKSLTPRGDLFEQLPAYKKHHTE